MGAIAWSAQLSALASGKIEPIKRRYLKQLREQPEGETSKGTMTAEEACEWIR